jgi:hypothetical protein
MTPFPVIVVVTAITRWRQLKLHAECHAGAWNATAFELALIHHHVGDAWLDVHRL